MWRKKPCRQCCDWEDERRGWGPDRNRGSKGFFLLNFYFALIFFFVSHFFFASILLKLLQEPGQTNNLNLLLISQLYKPYFSGKKNFNVISKSFHEKETMKTRGKSYFSLTWYLNITPKTFQRQLIVRQTKSAAASFFPFISPISKHRNTDQTIPRKYGM